MAGPRINVKEVVNDIREGVDDVGLINKYKLTAAQLEQLFRKLVEKGYITQKELDSRVQFFEGTVELVVGGFPDPGDREAKKLLEPLILATKNGHLPVVQGLVNRGADVNSKGMWGMTPLMWAASKGHLDVVRFLLDRGAHVNAEAGNRSTALMWTAFAGHDEIVKLLLQKGAYIDARSAYGRTALVSAIYNGRLEVAKTLLAKGARIHFRDKEGKTALDYAREKGFKNLAAFLQKLEARQKQ